MDQSTAFCDLLLSKLEDQTDRIQHLLDLIPPDNLEWQPQPNTLRLCEVLGHLLECMAGFCAALQKAKPEGLAHLDRLRQLPVNHCAGIEETRERVQDYVRHIREGFALLEDDDLKRSIPTVFLPEGQALMAILLGNLEHLINHKYQLFFYLKLLGVDVSTNDLYRIG